jgi:hypothetical protein
MRILEQITCYCSYRKKRQSKNNKHTEILGMVLLNLQLPPTYANHACPAMPDGGDRSSIAFL